MAEQAFLDTGVVLAFAFTTDKHHFKCRKYLESGNETCYVSERVEDEYRKKQPELADKYSDAIFKHIADLKQSNFSGQLDPMDIKSIRENVLYRGNDAYQFLYWFYRKEVSKYLPMQQLLEQLRTLARDIDTNAVKRRHELEESLVEWVREDDYKDVEAALNVIHTQDRLICIDAHDLAEKSDEETELATTNPNDFVRNGHRELILENTALDDVVSLAVTS
ncbi:hypothetical protein [Halarchaeum nitratireducens]|uniref:PIN domain-containing protein n=1 Tax=Halarchaeum nitratireducens TaxID=489913 RepID=A0A830G7N1_9EURY|nr:hypothetical protein [Halarchaeum nitratireducens]GGN08028.1 hypothetical protein GCM10009021_04170 [Halarchaeum nitratireducens]